jgi:uncharacterized protein (TIGR03437 family)
MHLRMFSTALACLTLSASLLLSSTPGLAQIQERTAAPQQTTDVELKVDDGTTESSPVSFSNLVIVNRLTPSRYPATLKAIRIFFRQVTPSPIGKQIRLVAFARANSDTAPPSNPTYLVNQTVTIPTVSATGEFAEFPLANGPTINSGDFFIGFQQSADNTVPFFWYDTNEPLANRGYASFNNGVSYTGDIRVGTETGPFVNFMLRALVSVPGAGPLATVSAASFTAEALAPETISAAFGTNLANSTTTATTVPLPTTLGGVTVTVRDSAGQERLAPLFFVSPGQINYLIPAGSSSGSAVVTVANAGSAAASGAINIAAVAPGLFTANANGLGVPAAVVLRVRNGVQTFETLAQFDSNTSQYVPSPINLGPETDQVILLLFGTGIRGRSALAAVTCQIGGTNVPVSFAGAQGDLAGLDQLNIGPVPRTLAGRGEVDVVLMVDGKPANTVKINLQ